MESQTKDWIKEFDKQIKLFSPIYMKDREDGGADLFVGATEMIKSFIASLLLQQHIEDTKFMGKGKREWYERGWQDAEKQYRTERDILLKDKQQQREELIGEIKKLKKDFVHIDQTELSSLGKDFLLYEINGYNQALSDILSLLTQKE